MESPAPTTFCTRCAKPATQCCAQCKAVHYCDQACQKKDWRLHKSLCSTIVILPPRPSKNHRRAILLPENGTAPQLVWITVCPKPGCDPEDDDDEEFDPIYGVRSFDPPSRNIDHFEAPFYDGLLGSGPYANRTVVIGKQGGGEHLDHGIWIVHRDAFLLDGSKPNATLRSLTDEDTAQGWRGPLLLYGVTKVVYPGGVEDLHASDLSVALKALEQQARELKPGREAQGL